MYISLKWKAVVFLSLVLIAISSVWTWQFIRNQLDEFDLELVRTHKTQTDLLSELVMDNFLRLSQFSELISGRQVVQQSLNKLLASGNSLQQSLEQDWISYHVNIGLDYLAIYNSEHQMLGEVSSPELHVDDDFQFAVLRRLDTGTRVDEPMNLIYCRKICLLIVLQPFINDQGATGTIVLAQNMADVVRIFYNFSNSGLGILLQGNAYPGSNASDRYLADWKTFAWAVSDFRYIFPIIKKYADTHELKTEPHTELFELEGKQFMMSTLHLANISSVGDRTIFVSVEDKSAAHQLLVSVIKRALFTVVSGLLVAEFMLLLLIHRPMKKLENITEALHLLPQQNFAHAVQRVANRKSIFMDELSVLEHSTVYVARELEKLHMEVNLKNLSLEEQVHALTRSRSFLKRLFDNSQIFIITQDFDFNIQSTNKKFDSLFEGSPEKFSSLIYDVLELDEFKRLTSSLKNQSIDVFQQEYHLLDKHNKKLIITWTHTLVEDEQGSQVILSIGMDQTRQKMAEKELRWMANNDGLTGIGNRRFFNSRIREMLSTEVSGALIFIDVNRFKQINDIYGHNAGDLVLIDISNRLRRLTRSVDTISRFAGDEFTILMGNIGRDDLPAVLEKLSTELTSSIALQDGRNINYSVSIGASVFPEQGNDPQSLIINADMAMYHAKKKGMGRWHLFETTDERVYQIKKDHNLILAIKHALKTGSFTLAYQPVLDITKNRISHYEVLIRLQGEDGEQISPAVFIPLAEKTGEIRNIDEWVLDKSLSTLRSRATRGDNLTIAINISAPTMQADDFPEMVFSALDKYAVDTSKLIIELTETAYIENFQQVLSNLRQITDKGVRVALDDFGVGFSSFTYLKMLPLSYVKLDGSYIQNIVNNPDDQVFVKSLSAMVQAFGMKVIAEFVSDEKILAMVTELGVTHGQGYFIGKPQPFNNSTDTAEGVDLV